MKLTLTILDTEENNAKSLIEYLRSLDFITLEVEKDFTVPEAHKNLVRKRVKSAGAEKTLHWDKVKDSFKLD